MATRCQFWLPRKNRYCANCPLRNSFFCGNHTERSDDYWITCPIDPSHSVLKENLESHLKKCPFLKQAQSLSRQPYYQKAINAGMEDQGEEGAADLNSESKRKAVYAMTHPEFLELIRKIKSIHASICNDIRDSFKNPVACATWTNRQVDRKLPFQEKHVLQQASILGNLEDFGVLRNTTAADVDAVVEFGAGRGYLTQMLADCYDIKKVLLVERRSYKLKADRSLRQIESLNLERLRIDSKVTKFATNLIHNSFEDLNLKDVQSLQGVPYLAIGKHLCGSATDMALRCCVVEQSMQNCAAQTKTNAFLKGLAIATCCHHLCQWKHYINKKYMSDMGFNREDFHAITWLTSWAVDADHHLEISGSNNSLQHLELMGKAEVRSKSGECCGVGEVVREMKAAERAVLGFMCKDIIDAGRLMWLKEQGLLSAQIVKYVPPNISPENHLLMARPTRNDVFIIP